MLFVEALECALPGRGRSAQRAGCEHRLDLRHRFPPWTGGVLQYINGWPDRVRGTGPGTAAEFGDRFEPPASLVERAESGEQYI